MRSVLKLAPPSHYSGHNDAQEAGIWLFSLQQNMALSGASDQDKIVYVTSFFRLSATVWYHAQCSRAMVNGSPLPFESFAAFSNAFLLQFGTHNSSARGRDRLHQLVQKTSVRAYNTEFLSTTLEIKDLHDTQRLDAYLRGLKPDIRVHLYTSHEHASFEESMAFAERYDSLTFQSSKSSVPRPRFDPPPSYRPAPLGPTPMELGNLEQDPTSELAAISKFARLTDAERDKLRAAGACFYCRKPGHMASECPTRPVRPINRPNGQGRRP